jgi:hypothetical protein
MTSDQFVYWLQGFAELHGEPPTAAQWKAVKDHLDLVFTKVTPPVRFVRTDDLVRAPSDISKVIKPTMSSCKGRADTTTRMYC